MISCLCQLGQRCTAAGCDKRGERDGVCQDGAIPGAAWCVEHTLPEEERTAIWRSRVFEQEERERAGS